LLCAAKLLLYAQPSCTYCEKKSAAVKIEDFKEDLKLLAQPLSLACKGHQIEDFKSILRKEKRSYAQERIKKAHTAKRKAQLLKSSILKAAKLVKILAFKIL